MTLRPHLSRPRSFPGQGILVRIQRGPIMRSEYLGDVRALQWADAMEPTRRPYITRVLPP